MWLAVLLLTGCATAPPDREPPPTVAEQPPDITTQQAVSAGETSAAQTEAAVASAEAAERAQRARPSALSTREIREQNSAAPSPLDFPQRLDYVHDRIYTKMQGFVESADTEFAGADGPTRPVPAAPFRIGTSLLALDRSGGPEYEAELNIDIALQFPNLEKRLRIFVTSDALDSGVGDRSEGSGFRAGLRYEVLRHLDFDVGIRVDIPPVAFTTLKWSREIALGKWDFYPLVKLFAETKESVGYALGTTFDQWTGRRLLRSSTFAKWRHDRDRTEWVQTFVLARAKELIVPDRYGSYPAADDIGRGWGLRMQASGPDGNHVSRYETGLFIRGGTRHRWLYWFVEPLVRWDREWDWSADPGIRVGVDMLFWDLARAPRPTR